MAVFSAEQVIEAFYRAVLNRVPDSAGMKAHVTRLNSDPAELMVIAQELFDCDEHTRLADNSPGITDHSQFGEFKILLGQLIKNVSNVGMIVDVGARGRERSNSFDLLSHFGWRGILIEANPSLYKEIEVGFKGTDYKLVKCAVGTTEGKLPFYVGSNDDVSSLLKDAAEGWGELRGQIDVEVKRLPDILRRLKVPHDFDVLSIDIEGVDVPVLNDLIGSSRFRPKYVIIEASYSFKTKRLSDVKCSDEVQSCYEMVGQTEANLILKLRSKRRTFALAAPTANG